MLFRVLRKRWAPIFGQVRGVSKVESSGRFMPRGTDGATRREDDRAIAEKLNEFDVIAASIPPKKAEWVMDEV